MLTRQALKDIKHIAVQASEEQRGTDALAVCDLIRENDLFIGESPNLREAGVFKVITARYPALCLTCGGDIPVGSKCEWSDNVGCVCSSCIEERPAS